MPPLPIRRLSRLQIETTAPGPKTIRLYDGRGLYIEIMPNGSRWWRFKYRFANKEKRLSLGVYPEIPIADARERLDKARRLLYEGIDPSAQRKAAKAAALLGSGSTFEIIASEWFAMNSPRWVTRHSEKIKARLENDVYPWLGKRPIADITPELLATIRRIESRGAIETAHRAMQNCSQVFRFAVATGRAPRHHGGSAWSFEAFCRAAPCVHYGAEGDRRTASRHSRLQRFVDLKMCPAVGSVGFR